MAKILFVEDEEELHSVVLDWLSGEDHLVELVSDGADAMQRLRLYEYDLIILDWMLPQLSGLEILKQFRFDGGKTPVIMLTGKRDIEEKTSGFDAGADDYLTKPFHVKELASRVRALLRRPPLLDGQQLKIKDIVLEPKTHKLTKAGQQINLLPKEFALLEFLMRNPNQVFSPEALISRVWSIDSEASASVIRTYINRIRTKIDTPGEVSLISTVHGVGYRLDP